MNDRRQPVTGQEETRAEVARRRLADLAAAFEASTGARPRELADDDDPGLDDLEDVDDLEWGPLVPPPTRGVVGHRGVRRPVLAGRRPPPVTGLHVRAVATLAVAAGVLLTWWVLAERPRTSDPVAPVRLSAEAGEEGGLGGEPAGGDDATASQAGEVVVDVAGRVKRPGIVTLPAGSRVFEAVRAAGGLEGTIEEPTLNMARPLVDGEQILVGIEPAVPDPLGPGAADGAGPAGGGGPAVVDLNTATIEQLDTLPGIGPVTAQSILDWRAENGRFASVEDLLSVSGIGEKTLAELRDRVRV